MRCSRSFWLTFLLNFRPHSTDSSFVDPLFSHFSDQKPNGDEARAKLSAKKQRRLVWNLGHEKNGRSVGPPLAALVAVKGSSLCVRGKTPRNGQKFSRRRGG